MSTPFADLSEGNHEQIRKYLRFFRNKKDGILRAVNREFNDVKTDRLHEDMYSKDDVHEFADFLASAIRSQVSHDVATIINMGALAINQLLENSQDKGVELTLETSTLENSILLEQIDKMSLDSLPKVAKRGGALTSFKDEAKAMREESARLEDTNNRLQAEVNLLKHKLSMTERSNAESKRDDASEKAMLRRLEQALEEAKEENSKRVSETSQFQQMRKMMQSQSTKIRDLRRRLEKYEPNRDDEDEEDD